MWVGPLPSIYEESPGKNHEMCQLTTTCQELEASLLTIWYIKDRIPQKTKKASCMGFPAVNVTKSMLVKQVEL